MTAAEVPDVMSRLPDCAGEASDAVSASTKEKNGRCSQIVKSAGRRLPSNLGIRIKIMGHDRSCGTMGKQFGRTSMSRIIVGTKTR